MRHGRRDCIVESARRAGMRRAGGVLAAGTVREALVKPRQITILQGRTFMVSDTRGDVDSESEELEGLFFQDMRHLSRWELRLNGRQMEPLAAEAVDHDDAVIYLTEPTGTVYRNPTVSVLRRQHVSDGLHECLEVVNHGRKAVALELTVLFGADFADIFEVKDKMAKTGRLYSRVADGHVVLGYQREDFRRETHIEAGDGFYTQESVDFRLTLKPGECWQREILIWVKVGDHRPAPNRHRRAEMPASLEEWLDEAPALETDSDDLRQVYRRSLIDLAALRFYPDGSTGASLPAAGLPWFMALFGRDSLIVSYQALPFAPELARTTLRALAARQATEVDDFRDAEPGKILHELRNGELTHFHQRPQSPYYGSADATPLFLIVLDEYERWTGDRETVRSLEASARAALAWMEQYGDRDGDGFIEYATRNAATGLVNQCWKDSWNSVVHPDGTLATLPRATCELQGYAYDARRRTARLAREVWGDRELAERLDRDADELRRRFQAAYWLADEGYYALALDGDKQPVRTLTSNIGHLLWSGIVPDEQVDSVVGHLRGDALFSGWGVRTLAEGQPVYNPMEYHNGSVWPHDNALIAAGLARCGRRAEAARIAESVLDAATLVDYRLPEALVGTPRQATRIPIPYPSACSPQAWASGTPLMLLRTMLGMQPTADGLSVDPHLPESLGGLVLRGVPTRRGRVDAGR